MVTLINIGGNKDGGIEKIKFEKLSNKRFEKRDKSKIKIPCREKKEINKIS